ncbi:MAG: hypothetical protein GOVbin4685_66 [Prokaryotic dsDNA virus sp.]|jgi:hypothetical protein|nr:MAG: hypothetical protein GOVbin4685_66 [Prokaryotic dsDNA virus sp.]
MNTQSDKDRLEHIATAAMQGLLANEQAEPFGMSFGAEYLAARTVRIARALIAELDREEG